MNKTTRVTLAATAASALALTGCSGSSGDDTVNLRMVETLTNPVRQEILGELIDEFEADNPGVTVELVSPPNESALTTVPQMLQSRSEEYTSELQSLMRNTYAVFCLKNKEPTDTSQTIK